MILIDTHYPFVKNWKPCESSDMKTTCIQGNNLYAHNAGARRDASRQTQMYFYCALLLLYFSHEMYRFSLESSYRIYNVYTLVFLLCRGRIYNKSKAYTPKVVRHKHQIFQKCYFKSSNIVWVNNCYNLWLVDIFSSFKLNLLW